MPNTQSDIVLKTIVDNVTTNNCLRCGKQWVDETPTPGLIHRTMLCENCRDILEENNYDE
jgi:hypothetical protein